jgi:hypothetical protein
MSCPAPTDVVAVYDPLKKEVVLTWSHPSGVAVGFTVSLDRKDGESWTRKVSRGAVRNSAKYTFRKQNYTTGEHWRACISAMCANCESSATVCSADVVIP